VFLLSKLLRSQVMMSKTLVMCFVLLGTCAVSSGQVQTPDAAPTAPSVTSSPQAAAQAASRPHPITLAATQQGVLSCSGRINQVVNALGVTDKSGVALMLPPAQQDQRLVPLVLEMSTTQGGSAYISATFAPNQANGCGANYDAVVYWPKSCNEVAQQSYASLKLLGRLKKDVVMLDGGVNMKVFLLPAGPAGCISIKREILL